MIVPFAFTHCNLPPFSSLFLDYEFNVHTCIRAWLSSFWLTLRLSIESSSRRHLAPKERGRHEPHGGSAGEQVPSAQSCNPLQPSHREYPQRGARDRPSYPLECDLRGALSVKRLRITKNRQQKRVQYAPYGRKTARLR